MKITAAGLLEVRSTSRGSELRGCTFDRVQLKNLRLSVRPHTEQAGVFRPPKSDIIVALRFRVSTEHRSKKWRGWRWPAQNLEVAGLVAALLSEVPAATLGMLSPAA